MVPPGPLPRSLLERLVDDVVEGVDAGDLRRQAPGLRADDASVSCRQYRKTFREIDPLYKKPKSFSNQYKIANCILFFLKNIYLVQKLHF